MTEFNFSILVAQCNWRNAIGAMQLAQCNWRNAIGAIKLVRAHRTNKSNMLINIKKTNNHFSIAFILPTP
jgi:hypothetical protein